MLIECLLAVFQHFKPCYQVLAHQVGVESIAMSRLSKEFISEFTELMPKDLKLTGNEFYQQGMEIL